MSELSCPEGLSYLDFQETSILFALQRRRALIADEPGLGKGHPLTTRILTPEGYTPIGKLSVGDKVIGASGKPVDVLGVFDRGILPVYRVTTSDGASTTVDGEHLWTVYDHIEDDWITIDTIQLNARIMRGEKISLPLVSDAVEFTGKAYDIQPFTAGVQLANGKVYEDAVPVDPTPYETGSPSQRMAFLSGVIRSIGRIRGDDQCCRLYFRRTLSTDDANQRVIHSISQIVRSLGGLTAISRKTHHWRVDIYLPDDLWLPLVGYNTPRKRINRRWRYFRPGVPNRFIQSVRPVGQDHVRCISVNAPDNLYLTDEFIVTHNTVSALGASNNIDGINSMLVICLASHKIHWARAVEKWDLHGLSIGIAEGGYFPDTECVVINYDILHRHYDTLRAGKWSVMICDEAHVLQNELARRTLNVFGGKAKVYPDAEPDDVDDDGEIVKSAYKKKKGAKKIWKKWEAIEAEREFFLTGTPIPNRVKNMWTLIKRCDPRGLGRSYEAFAYRYCAAYETFHGMDDNGSSNLPELNRILKDRFMVRHLKNEVLKDLPPKVRQIVPLASEGLQKKLQAEKDAVAELLMAYEAQMGIHVDLDTESLADLVMRARPQMFDDYAKTVDDDIGKDTPLNKLAIARAELALAKVPMAIEYISNLMNQGLKVVVFAYHRAVIEALRDRWADSCALIYGGTPTHKRQAEADRFQEDETCNPFIGQYTAAGTGYTLIEACHVVCIEMTWLPYELSQAEDRCHRIGQEDTVFVHHLVVEGSMDEGMLGKIVAKQDVIDAALN
jgi:hypothetical protein